MPKPSVRNTLSVSVMPFLVWFARRRLLAAAIVLLLSMPALQAGDRVVLVMGDSLSAAYNMDRQESWVSLLEQRLQDTHPGWRVVNASISGDTSRGGLSRLPRALDEHGPDLVVIALGGNDGLRGVNPSETERNLTRMVELAQKHNADVLLAGVRIPPNYGQAYSERFEKTFRNVAGGTSAELVPRILDGVDEDPSLMMDDGIHPSVEAQPIILDTIWTHLRHMLGG